MSKAIGSYLAVALASISTAGIRPCAAAQPTLLDQDGPASVKGAYFGTVERTDLTASIRLLSGKKHAILTIEKKVNVGPESRQEYTYCHYVIPEKANLKADLIGEVGPNDYGIMGNRSSENCSVNLELKISGSNENKLVNIKDNKSSYDVSIVQPGNWKSANVSPLPNVDTGGLSLAMTYKEISEYFDKNGFKTISGDLQNKEGRNSVSFIKAYKDLPFEEVNSYCAIISSSGITSPEIIFVYFPYSNELPAVRPISISRTLTPLPGKDVMSFDLKNALTEKYGEPTDRNYGLHWAYSPDGRVLMLNTNRKSGSTALQTTAGSPYIVIEGNQSTCVRGERTFAFPWNGVIYQCRQPALKVDHSFTGSIGVSVANDKACYQTVVANVRGSQKLESAEIQLTNRDALVSLMNESYATGIDGFLAKFIESSNRSRGENKLKL